MKGLGYHLGYIPWQDIYKLGASSAFFECFQFGINVYIPHQKYQVKPHLSSWFSPACVAVLVRRNHFFRLYQQNKSSESNLHIC